MTNELEGANRLVIQSVLEPIGGSTFQPTGFPDLGAAEFERLRLVDGEIVSEPTVLVESVQSLANHFEGLGWDDAAQKPAAHLERMPFMEVRDGDGRFLSSSRLEPHRLAGAYVKDAKVGGEGVEAWMIERFGLEAGVPLEWRKIYAAIYQLDPLCLIHGVFFSDPDWREFGNPKVRRAISAVIEARHARPAISGGLKRDDVRPTAAEGKGAKEGYGFVPFGRTEYTAATIDLRIVIDLEQIRGYGLGDEPTRLLTLLAVWEAAALLERPLRLRTACDLDVTETSVARPDGYALPASGSLADEIAGIDGGFKEPGARTVTWE